MWSYGNHAAKDPRQRGYNGELDVYMNIKDEKPRHRLYSEFRTDLRPTLWMKR